MAEASLPPCMSQPPSSWTHRGGSPPRLHHAISFPHQLPRQRQLWFESGSGHGPSRQVAYGWERLGEESRSRMLQAQARGNTFLSLARGHMQTHACGCSGNMMSNNRICASPMERDCLRRAWQAVRAAEGLLSLEERKIPTGGYGEWGRKDSAGEGWPSISLGKQKPLDHPERARAGANLLFAKLIGGGYHLVQMSTWS